MLARNGERPATDDAVNGAQRVNRIGKCNPSSRTSKSSQTISAELIDSNTATALGITAHAYTPVLALCRELLAVGINPDQALEVWRGANLALRIRAIGEAAKLEVNSAGNGFIRRREARAASPMRKKQSGCRLRHPIRRTAMAESAR